MVHDNDEIIKFPVAVILHFVHPLKARNWNSSDLSTHWALKEFLQLIFYLPHSLEIVCVHLQDNWINQRHPVKRQVIQSDISYLISFFNSLPEIVLIDEIHILKEWWYAGERNWLVSGLFVHSIWHPTVSWCNLWK